jgi:hypothetical protein
MSLPLPFEKGDLEEFRRFTKLLFPTIHPCVVLSEAKNLGGGMGGVIKKSPVYKAVFSD